MELKLIPDKYNSHPVKGILIKGNSLSYLVSEITKIGLSLNKITVYPVPDVYANSLYGFVVSTADISSKLDINNHQFLQLQNGQLFIPENTSLYPMLTAADWDLLFKQKFYFFHPVVGLAELKEPINWGDTVTNDKQMNVTVTIPTASVKIPEVIHSFSVEMKEEDLLKSLNPPIEKFDGQLPFDMEKVIAGNSKEIAKYLAFLEKNPHLALQYAIPLDIMGTSRGKAIGKYFFSENGSFLSKLGKNTTKALSIFPSLFGSLLNIFSSKNTTPKNKSNDNDSNSFIWIIVLIIIAIIGAGWLIIGAVGYIVNIVKTGGAVFFSSAILAWLSAIVIGCILVYFISKYISLPEIKFFDKLAKKRSKKAPMPHKTQPTTGMFIPSAIDWDNINTNDKKNNSNYYFGGDELSSSGKVIVFASLVGFTVYFLHKLLSNYQLQSVFIWITFGLIFWVSYNLIRKDKYILKPEENETQSFQDKCTSFLITIGILHFIEIVYSLTTVSFLIVIVDVIILFITLIFVYGLITSQFRNNEEHYGNGGITIGDKEFSSLQKKYEEIANEMKKNKNYTGAAYIYLKLLKQPYMAAQTLKEGKQYLIAASIFLKQCMNKKEAAECYELAMLYPKAIELYKDIDEIEKVGDLYMLLNDKEQAHHFYQLQIDKYISNNQFIKGATIYKHKMKNMSKAQETLLRGWAENKDAANCLSYYFSNIEEDAALENAIDNIYTQHTNKNNKSTFFELLKNVYSTHKPLQNTIKDLAYKIAVIDLGASVKAIESLNFYNQENKKFLADLTKYKIRSK